MASSAVAAALTGVLVGTLTLPAQGSSTAVQPLKANGDAAHAVVSDADLEREASGRTSVDPQWQPNDDGTACPAPVWPQHLSSGVPARGKRVLVIGDSRTRDSRTDLTRGLVASGWTPTVRCWGFKQIDWGSEQVSRAAELRQLPTYVVIALGINDIGRFDEDVIESRARALLHKLGPKRHVLWMEEYSTRSPANFSDSRVDYAPRVAAFNRFLKRWASSHRNFSVIPWISVVKAHHLRLWDGIHYTSNGYRYRATAVVTALNARLRRDRARQAV